MIIKQIQETISTGDNTTFPQMTGISAHAIQDCATLKLWKLSRETEEQKSLHSLVERKAVRSVYTR